MGRVKEELFNAELDAEAAAWEASPEGRAAKENAARDTAAHEAERARREQVWARQYPHEWSEWVRLQPLLCLTVDFGGETTFDFDNFLMEVRCAPSPAHRVVRKAKALGYQQGNLRWRAARRPTAGPSPAQSTPSARGEGDLLKKKEVSLRFGVSERTVSRWVSQGLLKPFRRGQVLRFKLEEVEAFESKGRSRRR